MHQVLAAELKLESLRWKDFLAPRPSGGGGSGGGGGADGDGGMSAADSAMADEIKAVMRMQGVPESKLEDPAAALRALEQKRRTVRHVSGSRWQADCCGSVL